MGNVEERLDSLLYIHYSSSFYSH